jgi:hypothetical protein
VILTDIGLTIIARTVEGIAIRDAVKTLLVVRRKTERRDSQAGEKLAWARKGLAGRFFFSANCKSGR